MLGHGGMRDTVFGLYYPSKLVAVLALACYVDGVLLFSFAFLFDLLLQQMRCFHPVPQLTIQSQTHGGLVPVLT